jgi:hypothetical protein
MTDALGISGQTHGFSTRWVMASVVIYTGLEIGIALVLAPAIFGAMLASPMVQMRLEMLMHLASFYVGGVAVGVISPGVRLAEPAVGAFISVVLVFLLSVFLPHSFIHFDLTKIAIGGGIADWAQLLTRPVASLCPYATPNKGLFLCSASTPPAGGVHGMCGWNAANAVLKRIKR